MSNFRLNYYDLETCPRPIADLQMMMPEFSAPKGWKDAEKIAENIEEQRARWIEQAALSPLTGEILAAVWVHADGGSEVFDADEIGEAALIRSLFNRFTTAGMGAHYKVVDFNGREFDRPFLLRRAWHHGITLPSAFIRMEGKWLNFPSWMIDIRDLWGVSERFPVGSLAVLAEYLGVGEKIGDGSDFARLWRGNDEERAEALAYLHNDGDLLKTITERLLSLSPDQYGLKIQDAVSEPRPPSRPLDR